MLTLMGKLTIMILIRQFLQQINQLFELSDSGSEQLIKMRRKRNVSQLLLIAQDCHSKHQYNNPIKVLNQVIQLEPKNDEAYRLLGDAFDELDEKEEAEKNYKLGIDCNPLSIICYVNYGLLLYNQGRKEEAEKVYELCMEVNPNDPTALNNYSILLYELKKFDKAQEIAQICLKLDPSNVSCREYLNKITKSKLEQKESTKPRRKDQARPNNNHEQLLQLLWERDIKIVEKQSTIQALKDELNQKQDLIKELKTEIERLRKRRNEQQSLRQCKICLNKAALYINKKCGHLSSCRGCLAIVGKNCPLCRESGSFIRVYSSIIKQEIDI